MRAVEWLQEQQKELLNQVKSGEFKIEDFEYYNALYIEQAKEMEKEKEEQYNNMLSMLQETHRRLEHTDMISLRKQIKEVLTFKSE
jgi:hypothetical protein